MKLTRRLRTRESGTQLIEFGLVLPILVLLALGIIDMGGLIRANQVVSNAAREGARLSIMEENHSVDGEPVPPGITQYVRDYIVTQNKVVCNSAPTVSIDQSTYIPVAGGTSMSSSTVLVTCPYSMTYLPSLTGNLVPPVVNVHGQVQFRNFY